jgi:hypothetical protein
MPETIIYFPCGRHFWFMNSFLLSNFAKASLCRLQIGFLNEYPFVFSFIRQKVHSNRTKFLQDLISNDFCWKVSLFLEFSNCFPISVIWGWVVVWCAWYWSYFRDHLQYNCINFPRQPCFSHSNEGHRKSSDAGLQNFKKTKRLIIFLSSTKTKEICFKNPQQPNVNNALNSFGLWVLIVLEPLFRLWLKGQFW